MSTYADHALTYLDAGWTGVLPVPVATKFPPPTGFTGAEGADTSREQVEAWRQAQPNHSIALRMPPGVIGIDVDHYDKIKDDGSVVAKRGGDMLAECEAKWGPLPATWRSSAREAPSGIRFFRVPEGVRYATVLGDAIEVIQRHHRYAVVAPSQHSHAIAQYQWYRPDGTPAAEGEVPSPDDLPMLPARWDAGLREGVNQSRTAPAAKGQAAELLSSIQDDPRPMCPAMELAGQRAVAMLRAAASGSRHDTAMSRTMRIVGLAAEGHTGAAEALESARGVWEDVTSGEGREYEWDSLVHGAAAQAAGAIGASRPRELDPCEGGAGLGIEVMADPGETRQWCLIIDGLDDARVAAEYAGEDVAVIGMAGHESWRRDGIPVPELRVVAGTLVTILPSPEVANDLSIWNANLALAETCHLKGAAKPPQYSQLGLRLADYLGSLEEHEKAPALARIIVNVKSKPAPEKPKGRRLGVDGSDELPDTTDTVLGTTWADENMRRYRYQTDDQTWVMFERGRWRKVNPGPVNASLMRYIAEVSKPIFTVMMAAKGKDEDLHRELKAARQALLSSNKRSAIRSAAADYDVIQVGRDQFDLHPHLWVAANVTINLDTFEVLPHDPDLMLTMGSDVPYDPDAECPRFDAFLAEALPDEAVRDYVLQLFAVAMRGDVPEQLFPVFIGHGRNGKGALIRIMHALFGEMAVVVDPRSLLVTRFEKHDEEIARLVGKRLATTEEPNRGAKWNAARIKQWTGGDRLTGSFKGKDSFDFSPSHMLIMASNERPNVELGEEGSFWKRYKEIPFTVSFSGREDSTLEPDIVSRELSGVLNRLLEAGQRYQDHGLIEPHAVVYATQETRGQSDVLSEFSGDCLEWTGNAADMIPVADMYHAASKWWADNGVSQKLPPQARGLFNEALCVAIGKDHRDARVIGRKGGGNRERMWFGVRLRRDSTGAEARDGIRPMPREAPTVVSEPKEKEGRYPAPGGTEPKINSDDPSPTSSQLDASLGTVGTVGTESCNSQSSTPEKPKENTVTEGSTHNFSGGRTANRSEPSHPTLPSSPAAARVPCRQCQYMISAEFSEDHEQLCGRCHFHATRS